MGKTLTRKTPPGEFQATTPKESTNKNRGYKYKESYPISKYLLTLNLLIYKKAQLQSQLDYFLLKTSTLHESPICD